MSENQVETAVRAMNGRVNVTCDEVLDLSAAESMRERLLVAVARGGDVEILAVAVRQIDTANLQLLCAATRELRARDRNLQITEPSAPLLSAARRLGLTGALAVDDSVSLRHSWCGR